MRVGATFGRGARRRKQLQFEDVKLYAENGIACMADVRDYVKERIDLEREYADKLDKLSKKYQKTVRKSGASLYGAGTTLKADALANETASITSGDKDR